MLLRIDKNRLVRKVLLNCVQPTKESLYGDIPDVDVEKAIESARDREKWKKIRPSQRCNLSILWGHCRTKKKKKKKSGCIRVTTIGYQKEQHFRQLHDCGNGLRLRLCGRCWCRLTPLPGKNYCIIRCYSERVWECARKKSATHVPDAPHISFLHVCKALR